MRHRVLARLLLLACATSGVWTASIAAEQGVQERTLAATTADIHSLINDTLPASVDAADLFDVALTDEATVAVEAARLRQLLGGKDPASAASGAREVPAPPGVAADAWAERLALDRARLAFYSLPIARRTALLTAHQTQSEADLQLSALQESQEAQGRADAAEAQQQQLLTASQSARSEAQRLVAEDQARLLGITAQLAEQQADLARARSELTARAERTLAFHRRVRQMLSGSADSAQSSDSLYHELRTWLRESRQQLAAALGRPPPPEIRVEQPGDALADLAVQVDRTENQRLYVQATALAAQVSAQATAGSNARVAQLYSEVLSLNEDRLALLPQLSRQLRDALTGTDSTGVDQASAELRQLALVVRYHGHIIMEWFRHGSVKQLLGSTFGTTTRTTVQLLLVLGAFFWGNRLVRRLLVGWETTLVEDARKARTLETPRLARVVSLGQRILQPLSWLLLVLTLARLLPSTTAALMEVQLGVNLLKWILGGWLAVVALDNLAQQRAARQATHGHPATDALRLRSLRLVGSTGVTIGLILSTTHLIVGAGTIYAWTSQVSLWATIPIGLVIVRWWRETIFERIARTRRRNTLQSWVIANQEGWRSFPAAITGGVFLFVKGSFVVVRDWVAGFEPAKRLLAYLFRHQLDRMAEREQRDAVTRALPDDKLCHFSPGNHDGALLPSSVDEPTEAFARRVREQLCGVHAVIGERGSGRTTVLHQVADNLDQVVILDCPFGGLANLTAALAAALGHVGVPTLEALEPLLLADGKRRTVAIDNAHRIILPVMGGMAEFDALMAFARRNSDAMAWIVCLDRLVWRFVSQARATSFLFDEVLVLEGWSEAEIAELLRLRTREAGIEAHFDHLVPDLPPDPDDPERSDALDYAAQSYFRLVWDYADGNPGVALHTWRNSLGVGLDEKIYVTPFRVPDAGAFSQLPDSAVFVLRAVLQLERATVDIVTRATMVNPREVETALRFGAQQGYLVLGDGMHTVAWAWYRPLTRFLQRRHLLAQH